MQQDKKRFVEWDLEVTNTLDQLITEVIPIKGLSERNEINDIYKVVMIWYMIH